MDDFVESYIWNDSENENPPLIAEKAVNSSKMYRYLKHNNKKIFTELFILFYYSCK